MRVGRRIVGSRSVPLDGGCDVAHATNEKPARRELSSGSWMGWMRRSAGTPRSGFSPDWVSRKWETGGPELKNPPRSWISGAGVKSISWVSFPAQAMCNERRKGNPIIGVAGCNMGH
jgi:hypothetical protein